MVVVKSTKKREKKAPIEQLIQTLRHKYLGEPHSYTEYSYTVRVFYGRACPRFAKKQKTVGGIESEPPYYIQVLCVQQKVRTEYVRTIPWYEQSQAISKSDQNTARPCQKILKCSSRG
jgi:hypothetical protein